MPQRQGRVWPETGPCSALRMVAGRCVSIQDRGSAGAGQGGAQRAGGVGGAGVGGAPGERDAPAPGEGWARDGPMLGTPDGGRPVRLDPEPGEWRGEAGEIAAHVPLLMVGAAVEVVRDVIDHE